MEREFLERQLAEGRSLEYIGALVGKDPSTVGYWLKKHGLTAAHHERHASRGGVARRRVEELRLSQRCDAGRVTDLCAWIRSAHEYLFQPRASA